MKGYNDSYDPAVAKKETERVFEEFDATESDRSRQNEAAERAKKIARLKKEVRTGSYRADIKDIARLLTSAMDPTL